MHSEVACPFCGLLCDDLTIRSGDQQLRVKKNGCERAKHYFEQPTTCIPPKISGKPVTIDSAVTKAAQLLKKAQTPLFSGLGTDVNGMRAVMKLADTCGAIIDHMHADGFMRNMLVLQDLGWITTTMAEIKTGLI